MEERNKRNRDGISRNIANLLVDHQKALIAMDKENQARDLRLAALKARKKPALEKPTEVSELVPRSPITAIS